MVKKKSTLPPFFGASTNKLVAPRCRGSAGLVGFASLGFRGLPELVLVLLCPPRAPIPPAQGASNSFRTPCSPRDPKSSISLSYAPSCILLAGARRLLLNTEGNQPEWQGSQPRCCTSHGRMRPRREGKSIPCYPPARPTKRRHPQACG